MIIGRTAEAPPPAHGSSTTTVIYRWDGAIRSYQLHAMYQRQGGPNMDPGSDVLDGIVDVIE